MYFELSITPIFMIGGQQVLDTLYFGHSFLTDDIHPSVMNSLHWPLVLTIYSSEYCELYALPIFSDRRYSTEVCELSALPTSSDRRYSKVLETLFLNCSSRKLIH
jgi:hypothetical protein